MVRCPTCGIRLRDDLPLCSIHGAPPVVAAPSEPDAAFEVPRPELPGYTVQSLLGLGGFGAAFRAQRTADGVPVAIKVSRADQYSASDRLLLEAEALRAIGAPFVPTVYDVGRLSDGAAYMVMEFVRAPTLAVHLVDAAGPLTPEDFARYAVALVDLVAVAHDKGFVHCDLKPENVFVSSDPGRDGYVAKLFDFGLVRLVGARRVDDTQEEAPEGTPEYMSPEQCEGTNAVDTRSDVYALGVMLYEMATGSPPFWGNAALVQQNHRSRRPPLPSRRVSTPMLAAVEAVILRCLAKDPERRYAHAAALAHELRLALTGPGGAPEITSVRIIAAADAPLESPTSKAKATAPQRERRAVALVFFESAAGVAAVRDAMVLVGGQLAHTAGSQVVIAFGHEVGDNPTRAA
ncbi:MAG: serine/threonine protein kinase, partial [Deltaproteobacteria bacterium]|nr:serine/threonine protein kinase [Deltaproteobacteria bacterium]